jgi:biotin-(acetyl-CoA carboxylase) ligase
VAELLRAQPGDAASASARAASSAATDAIDEGLRARLLGRVHGHLNKLWAETLQARGCEPWRKEYEAAWLHSGQSVEVSGGRPAIVQGLAATGELMAVSAGDEAGTAFDLGPGDSDVDLMDGLVRRATST